MIKIEDALLVGAGLLTLGITMEARGEVRTVTLGALACVCVISWAYVTGKRDR